MILKVMCQPMTGRLWEHATSRTTESDIFFKCAPPIRNIALNKVIWGHSKLTDFF